MHFPRLLWTNTNNACSPFSSCLCQYIELWPSVFLQLSLEMSYWTAVNALFVVGSLLLYFGLTFAMYSNGLFRLFPSAFSFIGER